MSNRTWITLLFIALLYFLKVKAVVIFIDGITAYLMYNATFLLDVIMNLKDRHPWVWISLPFLLLVLYSGKK